MAVVLMMVLYTQYLIVESNHVKMFITDLGAVLLARYERYLGRFS